MPEQAPQQCPQLKCPFNDEEALRKLAEAAADEAIRRMTDMVYKEVGKSILSKFFYIVGVLSLAGYIYLDSKGMLPK